MLAWGEKGGKNNRYEVGKKKRQTRRKKRDCAGESKECVNVGIRRKSTAKAKSSAERCIAVREWWEKMTMFEKRGENAIAPNRVKGGERGAILSFTAARYV